MPVRQRRVELDFIRSGMPAGSGQRESFDGRFLDEGLNVTEVRIAGPRAPVDPSPDTRRTTKGRPKAARIEARLRDDHCSASTENVLNFAYLSPIFRTSWNSVELR
jgi:hypothetical protein